MVSFSGSLEQLIWQVKNVIVCTPVIWRHVYKNRVCTETAVQRAFGAREQSDDNRRQTEATVTLFRTEAKITR